MFSTFVVGRGSLCFCLVLVLVCRRVSSALLSSRLPFVLSSPVEVLLLRCLCHDGVRLLLSDRILLSVCCLVYGT